MPRLKVLHHVAGLQSAGLGDGAGEEVDDDGILVRGWDDEGEEELGEFGDARDGVEVCFAEGADAHNGEEEGEEDGDEGRVEGDEGAEDDVHGNGAEDDGEEEADEDNAGSNEVGWRSVNLWAIGFGSVFARGRG